jgi:hypothetical protein
MKTGIVLLPLLLPAALLGSVRGEEALVSIASRMDPVPWAGNRFAGAVLTAPGWLGLEERPEILYGRPMTDGETDGESVLSVRSRGFGVATESARWGENREMRRYAVVAARPVSPSAALALSYTWYTSEDDDLDGLSSWDLGLAWRASRRVQVSATGRNLLRAELGDAKLGRYAEAGIRVVLLPPSLACFAEARRLAGDRFDDVAPSFGAEWDPIRFLRLRGRTDTMGNRGLGVEIEYGSSSVGFHYLFSGGAQDRSYAYVKLHVPSPAR